MLLLPAVRGPSHVSHTAACCRSLQTADKEASIIIQSAENVTVDVIVLPVRSLLQFCILARVYILQTLNLTATFVEIIGHINPKAHQKFNFHYKCRTTRPTWRAGALSEREPSSGMGRPSPSRTRQTRRRKVWLCSVSLPDPRFSHQHQHQHKGGGGATGKPVGRPRAKSRNWKTNCVKKEKKSLLAKNCRVSRGALGALGRQASSYAFYDTITDRCACYVAVRSRRRFLSFGL